MSPLLAQKHTSYVFRSTLDEMGIRSLKATLLTMSWRSYWAPCLYGSGGGESAGVTILARTYIDSYALDPLVIFPGRAVAIRVNTCGLGNILV